MIEFKAIILIINYTSSVKWQSKKKRMDQHFLKTNSRAQDLEISKRS